VRSRGVGSKGGWSKVIDIFESSSLSSREKAFSSLDVDEFEALDTVVVMSFFDREADFLAFFAGEFAPAV